MARNAPTSFSIQHLNSHSVVIFKFIVLVLSSLCFLFSCGIFYLPYIAIFFGLHV